MRMPSWIKAKTEQLDLLESEATLPHGQEPASALLGRAAPSKPPAAAPVNGDAGCALLVPLNLIDEDPNNPRTDFPEAEIAALADDIRERGILEPIVVHPADTSGRYRIHFGAMRFRAARRAGLEVVPVVFREALADPYAQVAEIQKRHGLTPLDLARFIRARADTGESNATIAKRLAMGITTVAPHLELLDLPPELDAAMKSGRCTSPKTLHELNKLHLSQPEDAKALLAGDGNITRAAVAVARASVVAKRKAPNATRYDSRSAGRPTCQTRWSPLPEGARGSRA